MYQIDHEINLFSNTAKYKTLAAARKALRTANGGRLHGKFEAENAVKGWNLGRNEGCDTAVIVKAEAAR